MWVENGWQMLHLDEIGEIAWGVRVDCTKWLVGED
jgi:hypothetical protein